MTEPSESRGLAGELRGRFRRTLPEGGRYPLIDEAPLESLDDPDAEERGAHRNDGVDDSDSTNLPCRSHPEAQVKHHGAYPDAQVQSFGRTPGRARDSEEELVEA